MPLIRPSARSRCRWKSGTGTGKGWRSTTWVRSFWFWGRLDEALDSLKQARDVFFGLSDPRGEGYALHNLARTYLGLGQASEAVACFEQALVIRQTAGDRQRPGMQHEGQPDQPGMQHESQPGR